MEELRVKSTQDEKLIKVYLNDENDFTVLNANDVTFIERFSCFLSWLDKMQADLERLNSAPQIDDFVTESEEGISVNAEGIIELSRKQVAIYKTCTEKLEGIFGKDSVKKYFRKLYEVNEDFIPDEECILDFVEQMIPIMEKIYDARFKRIHKKYNANRTGKHSKTKDELIKQYKETSGLIE